MKKKVIAGIIVVVLLLSIVCCAACSKESSFDKVVKLAKSLYDFWTNEDGFVDFEISGDCGYKRGYDDYPFTVFIYIPFTVTDEDGYEWSDIAFFAGGSCVGFDSDFEDEEEFDKLDTDTQLLYYCVGFIYYRDEASEKFSKEDVMNAIVPTAETNSGAQE